MMGIRLDQSQSQKGEKSMRKKFLTRQLAVSVSEETWERIQEVTDEAEISVSEWIREAVKEKLFAGKKGEEK
jgi:predicted HicB family RNase H-like nuclease